jgi:hypothetical protein
MSRVVGFPNRDVWIPGLDQLGESGEIILDVAGQSLDYFPLGAGTRGTPYERRVLTTGQIVPLVPEQDGQLTVSMIEMALGRAGEQRFQFDKGTLGAYGQRFVRYQVQLARTSPTVTGGISPRMQDADDLEDYARTLWMDSYVVWSALLAMSLGGITDATTGKQLSPAPIVQDNILVGPIQFDPPTGGLATAKIEVSVQM